MFCWKNIDGIMRNKDYPETLTQDLKKSIRELTLGHIQVLQWDSNPKHTSKVGTKWLKDNNVKEQNRKKSKRCEKLVEG